MTPPWVESLIDDPDQPIENILPVVRAHGESAVVNALFDEGVRAQYSNHDRMHACIKLIDRIQAATVRHTRGSGV